MDAFANPFTPVFSFFPSPSTSTAALDEPVLGVSEMRQLQREFPGSGLRVVIGMLHEEGPVLLEEIAAAAERGDAGALRRAAHALRGAVANFGARRLGTLCQEIEAGARGTNLQSIASQLARVREEYARVELALQQVCLN